MFNTWTNDPEAFSGDYEEYCQFMQEQAEEEFYPENCVLEVLPCGCKIWHEIVT